MISGPLEEVFYVLCDNCNERLTRWLPSRRAVIAQIKYEDWAIFRGKDLTTDRWRWRHYCPECAKARGKEE